MPSKGTRVVYVTQRTVPTECVFVVNPDQVDPLIVDILEKRRHDIVRIAVFMPSEYDIPGSVPEFGLDEERVARGVLGCDDPPGA